MAKRSEREQVVHDWVVEQVAAHLGKRYRDIRVNPGNEENAAVEGKYPDVVVVSHGVAVEVYEVETESTVNEEEANQWAEFSKLPAKCTVLVPASLLKKARELVWDKKIASRIKVASYELLIKG